MITGCAEWCSRVADGLQLLARRIRTFPEGSVTPSPPPTLLSTLTDELLVIASDAVKAVAAEGQALSANAGLRLLAWTVADARGATVALDKGLALTVGRRLNSRALTVRKELEAAAENDREMDCSLDYHAMERAAKKKARDEVYIGFWELESLLPPEMPTGAPPSSTPVTANTSAADYLHVLGDLEERLRSIGCRVTEACYEQLVQGDSAIPPDLAERLGRDGVQRMRECVSQSGEPHWVDEWWTSGLPAFVNHLLIENACHKERQDQLEDRLAEWHVGCAELSEENEELRVALRVAEGRERALHEALRAIAADRSAAK